MFNSKSIISDWLKIPFSSLNIAGIFSLILVTLRTPIINRFIPAELFKKSLIVHVNLAILFWILSMAAVTFIVHIDPKFRWLEKKINNLIWVAIFLISLSVFIPNSDPIINNYIPVIQNLAFCLSIVIFCIMILLISILLLISAKFEKFFEWEIIYLAKITLAITIIISMNGFILSGYKLSNYIKNTDMLEVTQFYEWLFWGGGHLLQFSFTQIMCLAFIEILDHVNKTENNIFKLLFILNLIFQLFGICGFYYDIDDPNYYNFFTWHMRIFAGIIPIIFAFFVIYEMSKNKNISANPILLYIICSIVLFILGNILSLNIKSSNLLIPAHYHGSTVGVTIAVMGLLIIYSKNHKLAKINKNLLYIQPVCYMIGQIIHIIGLGWSGGYGVLRKTPGEVLGVKAKISMGMMGIGGMIAIIAGIMFTIMMLRPIYIDKKRAN